MRSWLVVAAMVVSTTARAEPDDAGALFERGRELVKAGKHADACPLFEQSLKLVPALGTELNLARCLAATGRLVEALHMYEALVPKIADANQPQREALVRQGLVELRARLPRLQIHLGNLPAGTEIHVDGKPIAEREEAMVVDPGPHRITADGAKPVTATAVEGEITEVNLRAVVVVEPVTPPGPAIDPTDRKLQLILGGAGIGTFAIGLITGVATLRVKHAGVDRCSKDTGELICDDRGAELLDHARTLSHVTTGFMLVGAGLFATAVVLRVKSRHASALSAWVAPASAGFAVRGAW
ncbi:MAG: tetratricopeptide repeat protein [Kofleriaceae bacterium]